MCPALPVNSELKSLFLRLCMRDDIFLDSTKDHFLQGRWTAIALPDFGKVLTHPTILDFSSEDNEYRFLFRPASLCLVSSSSSSFSFQRRSNSPATRRFLASTASYCSKAFFASYSSLSSLLVRAVRCAASPALGYSSALRPAFTPRGEITLVAPGPTGGLPTHRQNQGSTPRHRHNFLCTDNAHWCPGLPSNGHELAAAVSAAEKPHQQAFQHESRSWIRPLPVYGITLGHSSVLFIGCPVNIAHVIIGDKDPALLGLSRGPLTLLQPPLDQQRRDRSAAPYIGASIEGIDQDIAHQALGGNLPDEPCSLDRVGG